MNFNEKLIGHRKSKGLSFFMDLTLLMEYRIILNGVNTD